MGNIISASSTSTAADHLEQELEAGITTRVSNNSLTGEDPNLQYEGTTSINESGPNTGDEEDPAVEGNINLNLNVHDGNNNIGNPYNGGNISDPRIIGRTTARLHDPKAASYLLRFYPRVLAFVWVKLMLLPKIENNPFMFFSIVSFCMALLILSILFWMFEHSEENYSGPSTRYKILKGVYYIFGILAYFSLLPVLLTTN